MVKKGIPKEQCVFVARGRGNDELAPADELFQSFNTRKKELEKEFGKGSPLAHNRAYLDCRYEQRFRKQVLGDPRALSKLEKISARARNTELFLICYEGPNKACHRRILLRIAKERFGAEIQVEGVE